MNQLMPEPQSIKNSRCDLIQGGHGSYTLVKYKLMNVYESDGAGTTVHK